MATEVNLIPQSTDRAKAMSGRGAAGAVDRSAAALGTGRLIINADDWGRDRKNTDRTADCLALGTVSAVSAMVFMEDSERAAGIAREMKVDTGIHLNFTTPFSAGNAEARLVEHQRRLTAYLRRHRLAQVMYSPGLADSFSYVVSAQMEEYCRLYGSEPFRIDGHHHMHLSANVRRQELLPAGTLVRRNFSFQPGEKGFLNRMYRRKVDASLARRHRLVDLLFSLLPMETDGRLKRILSLAHTSVVEVETHPVNEDEYRFLTGGECERWAGDFPIARCFSPSPLTGKE